MPQQASNGQDQSRHRVQLGSVGASLAALGLWAGRIAKGSTPPFVDGRGALLPNAIAEERWVTLGGVDQYVLLRGRDRNAPLMLNVHGGPGMSERAFYRYHNAILENSFVVAYWDQRGAGKGFDRSLDPATLTIDQISSDLTDLIDSLLAEFGRSMVLLLAHSWGTLLSLEHLSRRPETVSAYIGVAQVTHQLNSEREGYVWALNRAETLDDERAVRALRAIGPPPWTSDQLLDQRNQLYRLNGFYAERPSPVRLIREFLATPETGLTDLPSFFNAMQWTIGHMWPEVQTYDAFERHRSLDVPIHLMLGRHDHAVSPRLAEAWLAGLTAPIKEAIWYKTAGHMVPAEDPQAFNRDVLRIAAGHGLVQSNSF